MYLNTHVLNNVTDNSPKMEAVSETIEKRMGKQDGIYM